MGNHFPLYALLFPWLLTMINQIASSEIPKAKNGCASRCGNVSIPYPFGMKPGCFLDEWFEIICKNNNNSNSSSSFGKPILNRAQLEVTKISVEEGTVQVRSPITFFNCSDKKTRQSSNLEGSPFTYSRTNKFAAIGCGAMVLMNSGQASIGGCSSICSNTSSSLHGYSCNGINCCQTTIPSDLKTFNASFLGLRPNGESNDGNECKFAFVADQMWLESGSVDISAIREMVDVPVELTWELYNYSTHDIFGTFMETNRTLSPEYNCSYWNTPNVESCFRNSSCRIYTEKGGPARLQCGCGSSFFVEGNPYLLGGCKAIDICKRKRPNECGEGHICISHPSGYSCSLPERKKSPLKAILIGVCSGILGLLFLSLSAWLLTKYIKKRRREKFFKQNGGLLLQQQLSSGHASLETTKLFKSYELAKATDQFNMNRVLGQGGQGTVYKGMLADGNIVAVKKSKKVDAFNVTEFINEVVILSQINHRNVVKLLGCCLETEVPLLVYEFIPNGTLFRYIHDKNDDDFPLTWEIRLRIATEIAGSLSYLHSAACFPIYHRDIKSSNILLDEKHRAKIADFGTSRSITIEQTHLTTLVAGTFGYLDPEYFQSSQFTDKSDVYSFGVVLAELLTGQKPVFMDAGGGGNLASSFTLFMEENRLYEIVDARVLKEGKEAVMAVANLTKRCLDLSGRKRPSMKEVAMELERIQKYSAKASNFIAKTNAQFDRDEKIECWEDVSIWTSSAAYGGNASSNSDMEAPIK